MSRKAKPTVSVEEAADIETTAPEEDAKETTKAVTFRMLEGWKHPIERPEGRGTFQMPSSRYTTADPVLIADLRAVIKEGRRKLFEQAS